MNDGTPSPEPKRSWYEPVVAILMGVTTIATAWCSYQSSGWSGRSDELAGHADKLQRQTAALHLEAQQVQSVQMWNFTELVDAHLEGQEKIETFYRNRIGGEFKPAYEKWLALRPFEDPAAPPHPFVSGLCKPRFEDEIHHAREEAAQDFARSDAAGTSADSYLRLTVLLAIVLFFSGIAGTFDQRRVRQSSLAFAIALLAYATVRVVVLPVA